MAWLIALAVAGRAVLFGHVIFPTALRMFGCATTKLAVQIGCTGMWIRERNEATPFRHTFFAGRRGDANFCFCGAEGSGELLASREFFE
jgi:hypothetical protein